MKIIFMGTPDFAVPCLEMLVSEGYHIEAVVTQPDRPKGRKRVLTPPPVKELADRYHLAVLQPEKLNGSPELDQIMEMQPDLIVTAAFGQLLPKKLLDLPPLGCINVHASLLPKYRGGAPIHKAIIAGEKETGVTIMYMVEALDAGDILTQVRVPIEENDDVGTMFAKLSQAGAQLLRDTIPLLSEEGGIPSIPQDESQVTFAPTIKREDEEIDWTKKGRDIFNFIRGMHPFPGAFTVVNGERIKVWKAIHWPIDQRLKDAYPGPDPTKTIQPEQTTKPEPGSIFYIGDDGLGVMAGDGSGVLLTEIQPAGKKRMSTSDFLRGSGSHWFVGMKIGR